MSADQCDKVLDELFQTAAWVHLYWQHYVMLFGTEDQRIELYNKRTGDVMGLYQRVLWRTVLLEVAKLLGPHKSVGNQVLSVRRAIVDLPFPSNDKRRQDLLTKFEQLQVKYEPIIAHRDRIIAHNDMAVVLKVETVDGVSRKMVADAIADIVALTNDVLRVFKNSEWRFMLDPFADHEIKTFLKILEIGNDELDHQREQGRKALRELTGSDIDMRDG